MNSLGIIKSLDKWDVNIEKALHTFTSSIGEVEIEIFRPIGIREKTYTLKVVDMAIYQNLVSMISQTLEEIASLKRELLNERTNPPNSTAELDNVSSG